MLQQTARRLPWSCSFMQIREKSKKVMCKLNEDVANVGHAGDVLELKYGFVYNFLVPTKRATLVKDPTVQPSRASASRSDQEVAAEEAKRRIRQLDTTLMSILSNVVKIKAVVQDSTTGALRDPISMQDVLTAIRKQTGVVLHEAFIKVPPGRTAQQLINQLGDHELPANILFPNDQEAVIRVHVIARPTKASKGPAVEEGGVAEEASASSAPTAE